MRSIYAGTAALIGWFALALQFVLILTIDSDISTIGRAINFFSYFTILSNIMVALTLTVAALPAIRSAMFGFFARPTVQTGIAVYITITGLVYVFVLRTIWDPEGWAFVADALLHYVMPLFYVGFWFLFVAKGTLRYGDLIGFLGFPVLYVAYSLVRGPVVDWYPYPFLDVGALGMGPVAINIIVIAAGFTLTGLIYIALDRGLGSRRRMALS